MWVGSRPCTSQCRARRMRSYNITLKAYSSGRFRVRRVVGISQEMYSIRSSPTRKTRRFKDVMETTQEEIAIRRWGPTAFSNLKTAMGNVSPPPLDKSGL